MKDLLGFIFRSPLRAAIVCGILVAVLFGFVSFPRPELSKAISDWRIEDVILSDAEQRQLLAAREDAAAGNREMVGLTEDEFRDGGFAYNLSLLEVDDSARRFVIQYTGANDLSSGPIYVAEREIFAAPWWSPHRFIYKAASAEVDAFREVLELTFERDVLTLTGLILVDAVVGAVYGVVVGLIVAVLRGAGLSPTLRQGDNVRHRALIKPSPAAFRMKAGR